VIPAQASRLCRCGRRSSKFTVSPVAVCQISLLLFGGMKHAGKTLSAVIWEDQKWQNNFVDEMQFNLIGKSFTFL
jgi:hypothetical protein